MVDTVAVSVRILVAQQMSLWQPSDSGLMYLFLTFELFWEPC